MSEYTPDPEQDRRRFVDRLEAAGVSARRLIDVRDGEKGTRTTGHQQPPNWMDTDDDGLSGNYGVHPGYGLIEFDVDDYDDEHDTDALDALPETFTVASPHTDDDAPGHRYYAVEDDDETKAVLEDGAGTLNPEPSWGEIKYKSKYVVGPGSQLDGCTKEWCDECDDPDGGYYRIAEDRPIATLSADDIAEVLRADPEFTDGEREQRAATEVFDLDPEDVAAEDTTANDGDEWMTEELAEEALDEIDPDLSHGEWVGVGFALVNHFGSATGGSLFKQWSRKGRKWDKQHAESVIDDAGDYPHDIRHFVNVAKSYGWDASEAARQAATTASDGGTVASTPTEPTTTNARSSSETTIELDPDGVIAIAGLGEGDSVADLNDRKKAACVWELIKRTDEWHVRVRRDNGSLWVYDGRGVWDDEGERALRYAARQALDPMNYGSNVLAELKAQARSDPEAEVEGDEFGLDPGYVALENGLLDLDAAADDAGMDAIRDLEPDDLALTRLPVEYDPTAEYDEWAAYVTEWAEDGKADALQEYVGYCLEVGDMPIHRAVLLVGSGANGKGTFLGVVRSLLGEDNTTSIELQTLANERDAVADFYGAVANIDDDLSSRSLGKGLGMFKKLVGGDRVRARRLYEDGFEFNATGKHLYAANEVPEGDDAFWRRWVLVEFPNHYAKGERDTELAGRLSEPEALSGVLNWAVEGRKQLLEQGYFTNEAEYGQQKRERWQSWGESADKFISECTERDPDADRISTGDAHRRYAAWCRQTGEDPIGQQEFTRKLKTEDYDYGRHRIDGKTQRGYKALGFTEDVPALAETPEREDPDTNLASYEEEDEDSQDTDKLAVNSARKPIYKAIKESDDGAPIGDVLEAVPHTPEKGREHIEAMIEADTISRDDGRLRTA